MERHLEEPDFWNDPDKSTKIMQELKNLKDTVAEFNELESLNEEIELLIDMGYEENDPAVIPEIEESLGKLQKDLEDLRLATLLCD